jgi:hypothetical protein
VRALLLILGGLAGLALLSVGSVRTIDAIGSLSDVRIEETRTPVPGSRDAELGAGKHVVFSEVADDGDEGTLPVPGLGVRIRAAGGSRSLPLEDYSGDFDVSGGGREAQAIATVDIPEEGRYTIVAGGGRGADQPGVVLGRPVTRRVLSVIAGVAGIVAGLGMVALAAALAAGLAMRRAS